MTVTLGRAPEGYSEAAGGSSPGWEDGGGVGNAGGCAGGSELGKATGDKVGRADAPGRFPTGGIETGSGADGGGGKTGSAGAEPRMLTDAFICAPSSM
jgi:hypothetical protein